MNEVRMDQGTTTLADGASQFRRRWEVPNAQAAMLIAHGMGEHSESYLGMAEYFAGKGYDVAAYDHRGYGRSDGPRGHIERFSVFVSDLGDRVAERRELGIPVVLYGHSLGGLMSILHLTQGSPETHPDLAVLSAPAMHGAAPLWQRLVAPIGSILAPKMFKPGKIDHTILTRDPEVQARYAADDLRVNGVTMRLGNEILLAIAEANRKRDRISVPTYVLHGQADELMPASATAPLADLPNVTYRLWPDLRHEPHQEPEWPEVLGEISDWLDAKLAAF